MSIQSEVTPPLNSNINIYHNQPFGFSLSHPHPIDSFAAFQACGRPKGGNECVIIYHCLTVGNLLCKQAEAKLPSPRAYTPQYNTNTYLEYISASECIDSTFKK